MISVVQGKVDASTYYEGMEGKANLYHDHDSRYYPKSDVDNRFGEMTILGSSYINNAKQYGFTIHVGQSSLGKYINDTYWLCCDLHGTIAIGTQLNGAAYPTWRTAQMS